MFHTDSYGTHLRCSLEKKNKDVKSTFEILCYIKNQEVIMGISETQQCNHFILGPAQKMLPDRPILYEKLQALENFQMAIS